MQPSSAQVTPTQMALNLIELDPSELKTTNWLAKIVCLASRTKLLFFGARKMASR